MRPASRAGLFLHLRAVLRVYCDLLLPPQRVTRLPTSDQGFCTANLQREPAGEPERSTGTRTAPWAATTVPAAAWSSESQSLARECGASCTRCPPRRPTQRDGHLDILGRPTTSSTCWLGGDHRPSRNCAGVDRNWPATAKCGQPMPSGARPGRQPGHALALTLVSRCLIGRSTAKAGMAVVAPP